MSANNSRDNDLEEAQALFATARLPFPPIPAEWLSDLKRDSKWMYATRSLRMSPYNLDYYLTEAISGKVENYVILGQAGHGANSYALHLYVVHWPLALFVQILWGGIYSDTDKATAVVTQVFQRSGTLFDALSRRAPDQRLNGDHRLVVSVSDFHPSGWTWLDNNPDMSAEELRSQSDYMQVLHEAIEQLAQLG